VDAPVKDALWELFVPGGYDYSGFGGSMQYEPDARERSDVYAFSMSDYSKLLGKEIAARKAQASVTLKRASSNLDYGNVKEAARDFQQARDVAQYDKAAQKQVQSLNLALRQAQAENIYESQQTLAKAYSGKGRQGGGVRAPAEEDSIQTLLDTEAAARQWDKLQKAQELGVARIRPLHVTLPKRGVRFAFSQPLQSESGKPLTISFDAANTAALNWPAAAGGGIGAFLLLWLLLARKRR